MKLEIMYTNQEVKSTHIHVPIYIRASSFLSNLLLVPTEHKFKSKQQHSAHLCKSHISCHR